MKHTSYGALPISAKYVWGHHDGPDGQDTRTKTAAGVFHPAVPVTWLNDEPEKTLDEYWQEYCEYDEASTTYIDNFPDWLESQGVEVTIKAIAK